MFRIARAGLQLGRRFGWKMVNAMPKMDVNELMSL